MLDRPGVGFDVLVVGYVSRFVCDLRTATNARHALHQAGATILFADDDILLSDAATRVKTWGMIPSWIPIAVRGCETLGADSPHADLAPR